MYYPQIDFLTQSLLSITAGITGTQSPPANDSDCCPRHMDYSLLVYLSTSVLMRHSFACQKSVEFVFKPSYKIYK